MAESSVLTLILSPVAALAGAWIGGWAVRVAERDRRVDERKQAVYEEALEMVANLRGQLVVSDGDANHLCGPDPIQELRLSMRLEAMGSAAVAELFDHYMRTLDFYIAIKQGRGTVAEVTESGPSDRPATEAETTDALLGSEKLRTMLVRRIQRELRHAPSWWARLRHRPVPWDVLTDEEKHALHGD